MVLFQSTQERRGEVTYFCGVVQSRESREQRADMIGAVLRGRGRGRLAGARTAVVRARRAQGARALSVLVHSSPRRREEQCVRRGEVICVRQFCEKKEKEKEGEGGESKESFEEVLKKVRRDHEGRKEHEEEAGGEERETTKNSAPEKDATDYAKVASDMLGRGKYFWHKISSGWGDTWNELISGPPEEIKKTVSHAAVHTQKKKKEGQEESDEEEEEYSGPQAIVVTDAGKSAWQSMQQRLQDSPLIQEVLKNTRKFKKQAAATDIGQKAAEVGTGVQNKLHDAREFWETSQSPLVYKISGAWDTLTAPTEEGLAIAAIQKLDPNFVVETWAEAVKTKRSEVIIRAHLEGKLKVLKPITGEGVYNKLAADIRTRKHDGIQIDTNILHMDELQVLVRMLEHEGPIILCIYMVQQINCIRNRAGEIIEGGESEVIAKYYTIAYKLVYDDEAGVTDWKIVDYHMEGKDQYY